MQNEIYEPSLSLSDDDVKTILTAIMEGNPDGIAEKKLLDMAEKVQAQIIRATVDYTLWQLIKQGKLVITQATKGDMTVRLK